MTKQEYIHELTQHLKSLPQPEIEEILADYREHFEMGLRSGKSEAEISNGLGHPRAVAQGYQVTSLVNEAKDSTSVLAKLRLLLKVMLLILVLAPFNFLVIAGPFLILTALTLAGWAIPVAIIGVCTAIIGTLLTTGPGFLIGTLSGLAILFLFIGGLGVAGLGALIMFVVSKYLTQIVVSYMRWNINFIASRKA